MAFEPKPFGKYFLMERIAVGGMAEIYKAKTFGVDGFEKLLAIKKILPNYSADKEFIAMLTDEAKLVVKLSHTNIVQIYDLGKVGDDYYISMEYIDGVNLREVINRSKELNQSIPLPLALFMASEIASGLDYAHSKRDDHGQPLEIVHRDISPQNILISFEGETKIVDFGIAKAAMNVSHTTAGILKGKVTYMSPEQASGNSIDGRTDIYSTGILLYEMITGERLFTGESQFDILAKIRDSVFSDENLNSKIPKEVRPLLIKALAKNPENRFESAGDLQIALTKLLYSKYDDFSPKQLGSFIQKTFQTELKIRKQQTKIDRETENQTRSMLINKMKSQEEILAHNESVELPILQDTTKPESDIKPEDLDHGDGIMPIKENTSTDAHIQNSSSSAIRLVLWMVVFIVLGGLLSYFFYLRNKTPVVEKPPVVEEPPLVVEEPPLPPVTPPPVDETPPAPVLVDIKIASTPPGAMIMVDNADTGLKTPAQLNDIPEGKTFTLKLVLPQYLPIEQAITAASSLKPYTFIFIPDPQFVEATLTISTNVDGASVTINDKKQENLSGITLKPGTYIIQVSKNGYLPQSNTLTIAGGEVKTLSFTLDKKPEPVTPPPTPKPTPNKPPVTPSPDTVVEKSGSGKLRVDSNPRGGAVTIDGRKAGVTPVITTNLAAGTSHTIVITMPGYRTWTKTITMGAKGLEITAPLQRE
ncbi:protein kinase [bacterium]|nr:protein kinase [bacterium]